MGSNQSFERLSWFLNYLSGNKIFIFLRVSGTMDHEPANSADFSSAMDMNSMNGLASPTSGNNNNEAKRVKLDKQGSITAPSRVIHIRNIPSEVSEAEVIHLGIPFGRVTNVLVLKGKNQVSFQLLPGGDRMWRFHRVCGNSLELRMCDCSEQKIPNRRPIKNPYFFDSEAVKKARTIAHICTTIACCHSADSPLRHAILL